MNSEMDIIARDQINEALAADNARLTTEIDEARRWASVVHDAARPSACMHTQARHEHGCTVDAINAWRAEVERLRAMVAGLEASTRSVEQIIAQAAEFGRVLPQESRLPKLAEDVYELLASADAQARAEERERAARLAENFGGAPPNPSGRRAALAASIRKGAP